MTAVSNSQQHSDPKILVALDYDNLTDCLNLVRQLNPAHCRLKVGKELFTGFGPQAVEQLQKLGFDVFLDLKFHDIPATVAKAVSAAANMGVWMVNVHASGGPRMMTAAAEAIANVQRRPLLIGVTVLTSMDASELASIGFVRSLTEQVSHLAGLAADSGLDGVVCSAQEAAELRRVQGDQFVLVTPGIRPAGADANDQRRIVTPEDAMAAGSHYLVIGRPITQAPNPALRCEQIALSIQTAHSGGRP